MEVGVHDLHVGHGKEVPRLHLLGALGLEEEGHGLEAGVQEPDHQLLEVEDDLHHVLLDPGDGGELVEDVLNVDAGDRGPRDGGKEDAPQGFPRVTPKPRSRGSRTNSPYSRPWVRTVKTGALSLESNIRLLPGAYLE